MTAPEIEDVYPLSPTQQGMLFHTLYAPDAGVYFEQMTCEIEGDLDPALFSRAWQRVVDRHTVLRSAYDWESMTEPVQVVLRDVRLPLAVGDWRELPPPERARTLEAHIAEDRERGFDLAVPPLLRLALFRVGERAWRLVWSHHHLLLDGWSMPLLFDEFLALYRAERDGKDLHLPQPRPYKDYLAWLRAQDLGAAEAFWRRELAGFAAATPLRLDPPAAGGEAAEPFAEVDVRLSREVSDALQDLARRHRLTLSSLVNGAWALLLGRRSGEPDVVFGTLVSGRPAALPGVETMVGLFLNTLPVRARLQPERPFLEWAVALQDHLAEARRFEHSPLVEVQGWSEVPRGTPLFESLVVFENYPLGDASGGAPGEIAIRDYRLFERTHYPLTVVVNPGPEVGLEVKYETARFAAGAVEELLAQLRTVLEQIAGRPQTLLRDLSLVTAAARRLLPDPAAELDEPPYPAVPSTIFEVAGRSADLPAVEQEGRTWSYGELAAAAATLAELLREAGLCRGDRIGVLGERSFGLVAATVGVLAAGGVLLPIDRRLPAERQRAMLAHGGVRLLVRAGAPAAEDVQPGELAGAVVLDVRPDTGLPAGCTAAGGPAPAAPGPDDPAYVFFTSGTTGRPKAVLGRHRGLSHFLDWQRRTFEVGPGDRSAQLTGLSFDVLLRDLFLPLTSGATLCLPPAGLDAASHAVPAWLGRAGITLLHTVPSLAKAWLAAAPAGEAPADLRCVFFAGEPLTAELVRRWREVFGAAAEVVNLYGPTETTLAKLCYRVPAEPPPGVQPLGAPLPSTQALVLAEHGGLCGIGEPGEIVLRTPFRSLGYLDDAEEDARRFVPNPSRDPADLLYRTGDLGCYRSDGLVEILGRQDDQVKVRGVRVEPLEVEAALRRHEAVREAAVVVRQTPSGELRLVAYVVPTPARSPMVAGHPRYRLPNGLAVAHLNKNETDYLFREIFELQAYLRYGIELEPGACVFDVGANIGLFLLFAHQACRAPRTYSFEPNPRVFELLSANASLYAPGARLFGFGISDAEKTARFTFFPGFSMLSGLYADAEKEKETIKRYMTNQRAGGLEEMSALLGSADEILAGRFAPEAFEVPLKTLSQVIETEGVERIDLLKVNVEKSELDVLRGVRDEHWRRIAQVVLEVDVEESVGEIVALLERQGFDTAVMQDRLLDQTELRYVYAVAPWTGRALLRGQVEEAHRRPLPLSGAPPLVTAEELATALRETLPPAMIPSAFVFLESLPLTANGKLDREALPEAGSVRPQLREPYLAPRDALELSLVQIWQEVLDVQPIGVRDSFFDLGGHSLLVAPLMSRIERDFGQQLSLATLFQAPTVERLAGALAQQGGAPPSPALAIQPRGPLPPLFLVHPLGGSALCYAALSQHLGTAQPVYGLDAGFLNRRQTLFGSIEEMAAEYVRAVLEVRPEGPYRLGGWSFGGLVAFEMAQQLVAAGAEVDLLALFDTYVLSSLPEPEPVDDDATALLELLGYELDVSPAELRRLSPDEQVRHVIDLGRRINALPAGYDEGMARKLMAVVRANHRNGEAYVPRPYAGRILFFQARQSGIPGGPVVEEWQRLTDRELELRVVASQHRELLFPPNVATVATELRNEIERIEAAQLSRPVDLGRGPALENGPWS